MVCSSGLDYRPSDGNQPLGERELCGAQSLCAASTGQNRLGSPKAKPARKQANVSMHLLRNHDVSSPSLVRDPPTCGGVVGRRGVARAGIDLSPMSCVVDPPILPYGSLYSPI